jgi:hypothetical protein
MPEEIERELEDTMDPYFLHKTVEKLWREFRKNHEDNSLKGLFFAWLSQRGWINQDFRQIQVPA